MAKHSRVRKNNLVIEQKVNIKSLFKRINNYITNARKTIQTNINMEMVNAYWHIGREIVEEEQGGKKRAKYGEQLIIALSNKLSEHYGRGFSIPALKRMRKFYLTYTKGSTVLSLFNSHSESSKKGSTVLSQSSRHTWPLSWSHYLCLMENTSEHVRSFYEYEAVQNHWSVRELERQMGSLLFERLAKSRDKKSLTQMALKGQEIAVPKDIIKDPYILEFLDLPESHKLVESKLEEALITHLQQFLLELGKGFAFVARQKRLSFDGDHYYADLVFYHTILKCYVIIDLKVNRLTHGDLGQMQLYVNYFDRECRREGDNPTIGLILCSEKKDAMVKYTLGDLGKQIFASRYKFYLPSEKELSEEIKRELRSIAESNNKNKKFRKKK